VGTLCCALPTLPTVVSVSIERQVALSRNLTYGKETGPAGDFFA
jgi:hypothetical protein